MSVDFFAVRSKPNVERVAEIKEWAAEVFRLGADVSVMVAELRCTEPGCPPLETVSRFSTPRGAETVQDSQAAGGNPVCRRAPRGREERTH